MGPSHNGFRPVPQPKALHGNSRNFALNGRKAEGAMAVYVSISDTGWEVRRDVRQRATVGRLICGDASQLHSAATPTQRNAAHTQTYTCFQRSHFIIRRATYRMQGHRNALTPAIATATATMTRTATAAASPLAIYTAGPKPCKRCMHNSAVGGPRWNEKGEKDTNSDFHFAWGRRGTFFSRLDFTRCLSMVAEAGHGGGRPLSMRTQRW
ncbi:hypothetical protein BKA56DRAFT_21844 [Ilyonectria sp. MPI-CAGE-AT-0026]|nr:hypothetical protein BKA56DRAFT_21844 [Ilyonectria sp. MPI-CAGE-AT-0026]